MERAGFAFVGESANADRGQGRKKIKGGTSGSAFIHLLKPKLPRTECFVLALILSR